MMPFSVAIAQIWSWFQAYGNLQRLAVLLLYFQVGCSIIGSLGVSYTGALVANLAISLFALVAIESGSQVLGRSYGVLLVCALLLDIAWFILFSVEIWQISLDSGLGKLANFSLQLTLVMQTTGFVARFLSSFIWLKMYRLGIEEGHIYRSIDVEARGFSFGNFSPSNSRCSSGNFSPSNSRWIFGNFSPSGPRPAHQNSFSDEVLGGSIYNPASLCHVRDEVHFSKEMDGAMEKGFTPDHDYSDGVT